MVTENNHENKPTDKPKEADEILKSKMIEDQDKKPPTKRIRRQATQKQLDHPLHGVKLVEVLETLVEYYGWKYLADEVNILCFKHNPTMKVSLKFLRKFDWAREHVEDLYIDMVEEKKHQNKARE